MKLAKITVLIITTLAMTGFVFKQQSKESITNFEFLKPRLESTKEYTLLVIGAMPEEHYDFTPTDAVMSNRAMALHIVRSIEWNLAVMKGTPIKWTEGDHENFSKADLVAYGQKQFDDWFAFLEENKATPELTDKVIDVLNHNAHHRGQMVTYLRLKGIAPPAYR